MLVLTLKRVALGLFTNFNQVDKKQAASQPIIEKQICCENSGDYDKDKDGVDMISDEEESPIKISLREGLGILDQLLHVNSISENLRNTLATIDPLKTTVNLI